MIEYVDILPTLLEIVGQPRDVADHEDDRRSNQDGRRVRLDARQRVAYDGAGARPGGGGAGGVGRAATLAVVGAAVLILASNYILTSIFVRIGL